MLVFKDVKPNLLPASCLALGMFDGVHLGHQKVIMDAINRAEYLNALSCIVTFANHPQYVTAKTPTRLITTLEDRLEIFRQLGVQATVVLDFTEDLSKMPAEEYLTKILIEGLNAKSISIGYDHRFGSQKQGDAKLLESYGDTYGYEVSIIPPVKIDGQVASSSDIRKFISVGEVYWASKLLGRPFSIRGEVIVGMRRGNKLGFPTANLSVPENIISPASGVYSGMVEYNGDSYYAVINLGKRPTFSDLKENLIEVHILNFNGDLYNKEISVIFLDRIRDERKFNSEEDLKAQIKRDCEMATVSVTSML